jgi:hypothetical protein
VGKSVLKLQLRRWQDRIELAVENTGPAVSIEFRPEIPLGAAEVAASAESEQRKPTRLRASVEQNAQDEDVMTAFTAEQGNTRCLITFHGGVQVSVPHPQLRIGDSSTGLRIMDINLKSQTLGITAYVKRTGEAHFNVRTAWKLADAKGARAESYEGNVYRMALQIPEGATSSPESYAKVTAELRFVNR